MKRMQSMAVATCLLVGLAVPKMAFAAVDEAKVRSMFDTMLSHMQSEDDAYFAAFKSGASITMHAPTSWQMGESGQMSLEDYKSVVDTLWEHTENYNFDIENVDVTKDGQGFVLKSSVWERYTMTGETHTSKADITLKVVDEGGAPKIVEYTSVMSDQTGEDSKMNDDWWNASGETPKP